MVDSSLARGSRLAAAGLLCLCTVSCGPSGREPANKVETVPVTAEILVDGEPGYGVAVTLNNTKGVDGSNPEAAVTKGYVNQEGRLTVGTYNSSDGAPPGEYVLTFVRYDTTKMHLGGRPPDMFKGKYANVKTSEHKLTVTSGEEQVDMGTIELQMP